MSLKVRYSRSLTGVVKGSKTAAKLISRESSLPGQARGLKAHDEFIRRFLLHILPEGFQRIRYYGFLANRQLNSLADLFGESIFFDVQFVVPDRQRKNLVTSRVVGGS